MGEAATPYTEQLEPGDRVGRYEILELLAVGGMAEIYLARATGLHGFEKQVVLKRIPPYYAEHPELVSMFLDEARLAARLQHPNVVQVYDIGEDQASWFFAMEHVEGKHIGKIQQEAVGQHGGVPLEHAIAIVLGAAAGLHAAHETRGPDGRLLGVVHRDVSPSNVLVGFDGCVKLIDFGIAKATQRRTQTQTGIIKGKYAYMSPEQCKGKPLDRRSDLFSLGILLYELTTGTRLFGADSDYAVMKSVLDAEVPRPADRRPGYPPALEAIVLRALARDRELRYPTAQELFADLERFARWQGLSVSPFGLASYMTSLFRPLEERPTTRIFSLATGAEQVTRNGKAPRLATEVDIAAAGLDLDLDLEVEIGPPREPAPAAEAPSLAEPKPTRAPGRASSRLVRMAVAIFVVACAWTVSSGEVPFLSGDSGAVAEPPTRPSADNSLPPTPRETLAVVAPSGSLAPPKAGSTPVEAASAPAERSAAASGVATKRQIASPPVKEGVASSPRNKPDQAGEPKTAPRRRTKAARKGPAVRAGTVAPLQSTLEAMDDPPRSAAPGRARPSAREGAGKAAARKTGGADKRRRKRADSARESAEKRARGSAADGASPPDGRSAANGSPEPAGRSRGQKRKRAAQERLARSAGEPATREPAAREPAE